MSSPVVVIGDVLIDELIDPSGSASVPGGSALNVAVGLAVLGVPAVLVGMIGDDADGDLIRRYLDSWNVPLIATTSPLGTGRAISDRRDGEPTYRFNDASVQRTIEFDQVVAEALGSAALVAISGFPFDRRDQVDAFLSAWTPSVRLAIDPNPRTGLLLDREAFRNNLERVARSSTLVKLGEEDAGLLYGGRLDAAVERYVTMGVPLVLATAGEWGASVHGSGFINSRPISPSRSPIVDTMGAGDATFAVALSALAAGRDAAIDWDAVLEEAMLVAAETIRHPGALLRRGSRAAR
jgi:fructokinase